MAASSISFENEVFSRFAFYSAVVLLKTVVMSMWTARYRIPRQVFPAPEDYKSIGKNVSTTIDADVERVRRCHQNDLENVLPFVLIGFFYVLTGADLYTATLHFQLFAGFRLLHTLVYLNAVIPPFRAIAFMVNFGVNSSMLISILMKAKY